MPFEISLQNHGPFNQYNVLIFQCLNLSIYPSKKDGTDGKKNGKLNLANPGVGRNKYSTPTLPEFAPAGLEAVVFWPS